MGRTRQECIEQLEELETWMDEMFLQVERKVEWSMSDYMNSEDAKSLCSPFYSGLNHLGMKITELRQQVQTDGY